MCWIPFLKSYDSDTVLVQCLLVIQNVPRIWSVQLNEKIASQVARRLLWLSIIRFPILHNQNRTKFGSWSLLEFQSSHFGFTVGLGFGKLARAASGLGLHTAGGRSGVD